MKSETLKTTRAPFMLAARSAFMAIIINSVFFSSCSIRVEYNYGFPWEREVKPDGWTKLGVIEKKIPKLGDVYVYGDTLMTGAGIRELVGDGLLIAEIDRSDDPEDVRRLVRHLTERADSGRLPMRTVFVAGGYYHGAAKSIKSDLNIPFAVYTTEKKLRNWIYVGPKLIYVTKSMRADTRTMFRSMPGEHITKFLEETIAEHNIR